MKRGFGITALSIFLAVLMAVSSPMQAMAASEGDYVSEVYIVTAEQLSEYQGKPGYKVFSTPLYENTYGAGVNTKTYLVVKLTNDVRDAITDIRALRMNGGYSFEAYNQYLDELITSAEKLTRNIYTAILEYQENYEKGSDYADVAYRLLNSFYNDDVTDEDGNPVKLGDWFLSFPDDVDFSDEEDENAKNLKALVLEGNTDTLNVIRKALTIACSRNGKKTFVDILQAGTVADQILRQKVDPSKFSTEAQIMAEGLEDFRLAVDTYYAAEKEYPDHSYEEIVEILTAEDFGTEDPEELIENLNNGKGIGNRCELYTTGAAYVEMLSGKQYSSINYQGTGIVNLVSVMDVLMGKLKPKDANISEETCLINELEYMLCAMTPGTVALCGTGIGQIFSAAFGTLDDYEDRFAELEEDEELSELSETGVSAFYGVDRDIFKKGVVAMTSKALSANATGDLSWQQTQNELLESKNLGERNARIAMIASGAMIPASFAAYAGYAKYIADNFKTAVSGMLVDPYAVKITYSEAFFQKAFMVEESWAAEVVVDAGSRAVTSGYALIGRILGISMFISLAAFLISVVFYLVARIPEPLYTSTYQAIPGILCDYRHYEEEGEGGVKNERSQYIYYYGVTNPDKKYIPTESLYADTDNDSKTLPANDRQIMDIYNWELQGKRQWLCLYTTKDWNAGRPIKADSLIVSGNQKETGKVGLQQITSDLSLNGYDLMSPFNASIESLAIAARKDIADSEFSKQLKAPLYIHFAMDTDAKWEETPEERYIRWAKRASGSMINLGSGIAMAGAGLAVGVVGGIVIDRVVKKHAKKKETEISA